MLKSLPKVKLKNIGRYGRIPQVFTQGSDIREEKTQRIAPWRREKSIAAPEHRMVKLLDIAINPTYKEAVSLQKRLLKYRDSILTFLHHDKVPPDNNASERAIRNIKVKQKISGQFKSARGADDFCVIRSVVDTLIKRSENVLENLTLVTNLAPE